MTPLNKRNLASPALSPLRISGSGTVTPPGYRRDAKSELFLRCTTMFAGEGAYYEDAKSADGRAVELARQLALSDWDWIAPFLAWLRGEANIRTMSIMLAAEAVHARLQEGMNGALGHLRSGGADLRTIQQLPALTNRQLIASVQQRPDEPAEMIAYWLGKFGRNIPQPVKRGTADALARMLNQRQALRWDKPGKAVRMGDVIELVHPRVKNISVKNPDDPDGGSFRLPHPMQGALYEHLITIRHDREDYEPPTLLETITIRHELNALAPDERHAFAHRAGKGGDESWQFEMAMAGSWEWAKSWLGQK